MPTKNWPDPQRREVGLFTDLSLFSEALELASEQGVITKQYLIEELAQRVQGLLLVRNQSPRGVERLIAELRSFKWLWPVNSPSRLSDSTKYRLTPQGEAVLKIFKQDKKKFLRRLTIEMHQLYTIPGWFVHRLWSINPHGQGEIVIPTPPRGWRPSSRKWEDSSWTAELSTQTQASFELIQNVCPGSFPIKKYLWIEKVQLAWKRLSNLKRRKVAKFLDDISEKNKINTYTPRSRLAMAMKEAAVSLLFSNTSPDNGENDFFSRRSPLLPRTYTAWCPRLEILELIFYTDVHPQIPGRLIFPTSVFRVTAPSEAFEKLKEIKDPHGNFLWLHQPEWETMQTYFFDTLVQEHQRASTRVGSLYVPLQDVRDEVCRQLRLSAACFDGFIDKALRESLRADSTLSISVETDIREDQRAAHRLIRRPVRIGGIPHSLIAVTEIG